MLFSEYHMRCTFDSFLFSYSTIFLNSFMIGIHSLRTSSEQCCCFAAECHKNLVQFTQFIRCNSFVFGNCCTLGICVSDGSVVRASMVVVIPDSIVCIGGTFDELLTRDSLAEWLSDRVSSVIESASCCSVSQWLCGYREYFARSAAFKMASPPYYSFYMVHVRVNDFRFPSSNRVKKPQNLPESISYLFFVLLRHAIRRPYWLLCTFVRKETFLAFQIFIFSLVFCEQKLNFDRCQMPILHFI